MVVSKGRIKENLGEIRERIAAACERARRFPNEVSIVAVTKTVGIEEIKSLLELGLLDLGESRVQQLMLRDGELRPYLQRRRAEQGGEVRWHMIGHLQRNKVRQVVDLNCMIHSVDSLRLAEAINDRADRAGRVAEVLLEVNCSEEPQKFGVPVGAASHMAEIIASMKHVRLLGLMTMAPLVDDPEKARPTFVRLRELFEDMRREGVGGQDFRHLSMGMSQDYPIAVEEGATMVRIGSALFA